MNTFLLRCTRPVALCVSLFVTAQMSAVALPLPQDQTQQPAQQTQPAAPASQPAQQPATNQPAQPTAAAQPDAPAPAFASSSQEGQSDAQNPVGTAVGPYARPTGVAGSRPSGAAIAPAKQRRVKAIFIRVGLIVAGAAAAGAVIGLSKESPARPQ